MKFDEIATRQMRCEEIPRVSEIVCAGYHWLAEEAGYTPDQVAGLIAQRGSEEAIRLQSKTYQFLVAVRKGYVVGVVGIEGAEVTKLFVDPRSLREGIGRRLFKAAEDNIMNAGHDTLVLGAFDPSVPFYMAMGMETDYRKTIENGPLRGQQNTVMKKSLVRSP